MRTREPLPDDPDSSEPRLAQTQDAGTSGPASGDEVVDLDALSAAYSERARSARLHQGKSDTLDDERALARVLELLDDSGDSD